MAVTRLGLAGIARHPYGSFADKAATVVVAVVAPKAGGIGHRRRRKVILDGKRYEVTPSEERQILEAYIEQQQQQVQTAEPAHKPKYRVRISRARKRLRAVETEEQRWRKYLATLDEELILLMLH